MTESMVWTDDRYYALAERSEKIHGHRHVLPIAVWIAEAGSAKAVSQSVVTRGLDGRSSPNKVLQALERLRDFGALSELPYPGRPKPRIFEKLKGPYWDWVVQHASEVDQLVAQGETPATDRG